MSDGGRWSKHQHCNSLPLQRTNERTNERTNARICWSVGLLFFCCWSVVCLLVCCSSVGLLLVCCSSVVRLLFVCWSVVCWSVGLFVCWSVRLFFSSSLRLFVCCLFGVVGQSACSLLWSLMVVADGRCLFVYCCSSLGSVFVFVVCSLWLVVSGLVVCLSVGGGDLSSVCCCCG